MHVSTIVYVAISIMIISLHTCVYDHNRINRDTPGIIIINACFCKLYQLISLSWFNACMHKQTNRVESLNTIVRYINDRQSESIE